MSLAVSDPVGGAGGNTELQGGCTYDVGATGAALCLKATGMDPWVVY